MTRRLDFPSPSVVKPISLNTKHEVFVMATAPKKSAAAQAMSAEAPSEALPAPSESAPLINAVLPTPELAEPAAEIQRSFRNALEKGVVEARAAFAKAKAAAEEAASAFEMSFAAAKDGALAINAKSFEALRANAEANFDFLKAVFGAKSVSDVIALQAEFARKQVETMSGQTKDIGALTQKAMTNAVEPIKEQVAKSFRIAV
jgi:phasin